jgi:hypothetical protein
VEGIESLEDSDCIGLDSVVAAPATIQPNTPPTKKAAKAEKIIFLYITISFFKLFKKIKTNALLFLFF